MSGFTRLFADQNFYSLGCTLYAHRTLSEQLNFTESWSASPKSDAACVILLVLFKLQVCIAVNCASATRAFYRELCERWFCKGGRKGRGPVRKLCVCPDKSQIVALCAPIRPFHTTKSSQPANYTNFLSRRFQSRLIKCMQRAIAAGELL